MAVTAFLHQKGGTGKSTLSVASAMALAGTGERVLLVDADPQGTSSEWALRFGERWGVRSMHHIQADYPQRLAPLRADWPAVLIDGPPALSAITESILLASDRVILPMRPAWPDFWALTWLAALLGRLRREGCAPAALALLNMHREEPLAPLLEELAFWAIPAWPETISVDPALPGLFAGEALPAGLAEKLLRLLRDEPAGT